MNQKSSLPNYIFNWKGTLALFFGMLGVSSIITMIDVFSMFSFHNNLQYSNLYLIFNQIVTLLGAIFAFDYFVCRPQTGKPLDFNFSTKNFSTYLLIFPMMFGMMLISEFFTNQIPVAGPFWGKLYDYFSELMENLTKDKYLMVVMAVISAPILEEIIFRGIIMKGLVNKGWEPRKAILVSALVFGLVHGNPWQFVGAVLLGTVLGLVYYKTESLLMPILLHAFNNLCSSIMIMKGNTESFGEIFHVSEYFVLAIGIVLFASFYYLFMDKYSVRYTEY